MHPLREGSIAALDCNCLVCSSCSHEHIQANMKPQHIAQQQASRSGEMFKVGDEVRYRDRHKNLVAAVVVQVDRSVTPPG